MVIFSQMMRLFQGSDNMQHSLECSESNKNGQKNVCGKVIDIVTIYSVTKKYFQFIHIHTPLCESK